MKSIGILRHWFARGICSLQFLPLPELQAPAVLLGSRFLLLWEAAPTSSSSASLGTLSRREGKAWHGTEQRLPNLDLDFPLEFFSRIPEIFPHLLGSVSPCGHGDEPTLVLIRGKRESMAAAISWCRRADAQSVFAQAGFSEHRLEKVAGNHFSPQSKVVFSCQH